MNRLALLVEYDGTKYSGWQRQQKVRSVQGVIESALQKLLGAEIGIMGSGRTDSGVHAVGQVAHCTLTEPLPLPIERLGFALSGILPHDVRVKAAQYVRNDFHARHSAIDRMYKYRLDLSRTVFRRYFTWQTHYRINTDILQATAPLFVGNQDFTTFSKRNDAVYEHYRSIVSECVWREEEPDLWVLNIRAKRFLWGMVRLLTMAMVDTARGKQRIEDLSFALHARNRDYASPLAPAVGLTLHHVAYPEEFGVTW
jgi:tRNA pseudouridine38-40 synthase